MKKSISRRDFLRMSAVTAASLVVTSCGVSQTETPEATLPPVSTNLPDPTAVPTIEPVATIPAKQDVTLEFVTYLPEYQNSYRQLLDVFEAENPGVKVNIFAFSEDTEAAYLAKVAGGYLPAMEQIPGNSGRTVNRDNYQEYMDLSTIDFPWFDRWMYDVRNEWSDSFDLPGPRTLDLFQGIVASFIYHKDIMDKIGWDPQRQVKTLDDLGRLLDDLNVLVKEDPSLDYGWDRAWINGFVYLRYMNLVPVAYPDGSRERQFDCWMGKAKFNAPDSPYRHTFEYSKEALERGWNTDGWWNREWEADQESTFISKKSAMTLHGPWMWDKAMAADPSLELLGFPFPSVDGKETTLHMESPAISYEWAIRSGNEKTPHWDETKTLFHWWFSPEIVKERAQIEGRALLYKLDDDLTLKSPQWTGLLQHVGKDFFSHVKLDSGPWGQQAAAPYQIGGTPGTWDVGTGGFNETFINAITGKVSVQQALDLAQANWEKSYQGFPSD